MPSTPTTRRQLERLDDESSPDGHVEFLPFRDTANQVRRMVTAGTAGTYRFDHDGITRPPVMELWWAVERGRPQAIRNLVAAAKNAATPEGAEAAILLERVRARLSARQDALIAAPPSIGALENLEEFLIEADGVDTKKAQARLKELRATKPLKDEERARDLYQQCHQQLISPKPDQQKAGKANLAALAAKMPATVYGGKAAAESR